MEYDTSANQELLALFQAAQKHNLGLIKGWKPCRGWFLGAVGTTNSKELYFILAKEDLCSIPLNAHILYNDIEEQCKKQGFEGEDAATAVWNSITAKLNSQSSIDFDVHEHKITTTCSVTKSMDVSLLFTCQEVQDVSLVAMIYGSLCKEVISSGLKCMDRNEALIDTLKGKDKTVEYLAYLVKDLGGTSILERWAPHGSINHSNLSACDDTQFRGNNDSRIGNPPCITTADVERFFSKSQDLFYPSEVHTFSHRRDGSRSPSRVQSLGTDCDDTDNLSNTQPMDYPILSAKQATNFQKSSGITNRSQESIQNSSDSNRSTSVEDLTSTHNSLRKRRKFGKVKAPRTNNQS